MEEMISVIVPVYNVEAYLDQCIASIVSQTYTNLEIILVDDGSPDNCPDMCDVWAKRDPRIKVIHKENGGLSDARNAGMAVATGSYIGFIDSDDYISPDMYRLLYERIVADGTEIAACGIELVYEDGRTSRPLNQAGSFVLTREAAMEAVILESRLKQPVCYKLYRSGLIQNLLFPMGKCHEDVFWTWQAVARADKVSVFDTPCYFYVQRSESIMGEKYSLKRLEMLDARKEQLLYIREHFPRLVNKAEISLWGSCLYNGQMVLAYLPREEQLMAMRKIKEMIACIPADRQRFASLSLMRKFWWIFSQVTLTGVCKFRNYLKIGM